MLISTGSQKVCKNVERTILQTGRNSPSRINSYGNVSRSNFYNDKISIYSFIFAKYETGRNRSRLSVSLSYDDHFAKLTKYKNTKKYFQVVPRNWKNIKIRKHVSICFAKLKNTKQCFELFLFVVLHTFFKFCIFSSRLLPLFEFHTFNSSFVPILFIQVSYLLFEFGVLELRTFYSSLILCIRIAYFFNGLSLWAVFVSFIWVSYFSEFCHSFGVSYL